MANTKESAVKPQEQFEEAYHLAEQATSEAVGAMKEHAKESAQRTFSKRPNPQKTSLKSARC
ncbi:hypothetical protein [Vibrio sp. Vb0839]|uniref:hypothetical protein n=1 Tax=Vibrio sp. Vb0839 TaxID=3074631 RepID=UPI0023EAE3BD|nr:hypothetical protein [Vibrio sp. Vb0839]MDF4780340.1 hypothetical protein [Vibrio parahaemolyticus]MDF4843468.1 hypothetical protein [Vibrio parahaemolyticus]MDW1843832.1 hypothetical protein [Vibrio sp. Vb0839]